MQKDASVKKWLQGYPLRFYGFEISTFTFTIRTFSALHKVLLLFIFRLNLSVYCSGAGVTLPQRKGRRLRSKYPLLISLKNKLFHYFWLWDFFIWCRIVFSSLFNNIVNWADIYLRLFHYSSVLSDRSSAPLRSDNRDSAVLYLNDTWPPPLYALFVCDTVCL
jgi:hypothetical protein